jgi:hypothetical protein
MQPAVVGRESFFICSEIENFQKLPVFHELSNSKIQLMHTLKLRSRTLNILINTGLIQQKKNQRKLQKNLNHSKEWFNPLNIFH